MRTVLAILIGIHGLIHLFGFTKAFGIYDFKELTTNISKPAGLLWLAVAVLFIITLVLYIAKIDYWWLVAFIGLLLSQIIIVFYWSDAKFGTIANIIILLVSFSGYQNWSFENIYRNDVINSIERNTGAENELLTKRDIEHLPLPVQNYIEYVGALNKPKVNNFKVTFRAEMRSGDQDWFKLTTEQHNFFDEYERLFFLKAKFKGLPTQGYHRYQGDRSDMKIKLFSTIPVVNVRGDELFEAETVTVFNDMCYLAPATLIDKRISWE